MVNLWLEKVEEAKKLKHDRFQQYADEAMRFYDGAHNFMWEESYASGDSGFLAKDSFGSGGVPHFKMTVNRVFEAVALFGPTLFARYPQVMVSPVNPPLVSPEAMGLNPQDPQQGMMYQQLMMQSQYEKSVRKSCSEVKAHYLNWLQVETDKKTQGRRAITESIIKGLGLMYTELYQPPGSSIRYPRSVYLNADDYLKDPDAAYQEDVEWIAIRREQPVHRVEEKFGLPPGSIRGQKQSMESQAFKQSKRDVKSKKEKTSSFDLIEYWEIYSKSGFGDKLKSSPKKVKIDSGIDTSKFGRFCYLAVSKDVPYPLNMPTEAIKQEDEDSLFIRAQWPVPFWTDTGLGNGWPVSELYYYEKPGCVWPISLIKPAIGELRFVNWCMSFLADRVAASCTTYVGIMKSAGEEIQRQLAQDSGPFKLIEISEVVGRSINDLISFVQAPAFSMDIWKMVAEVLEMIDKRTGLTELVYGLAGKQMRSAREADIRDANVSIRPDDMAEKVEDWLSQTCMKEMETIAWLGKPEDVYPALGQAGTSVFLNSIQGQEFERLVRDYSYRIEAGSAKKPNKANRLSQLNEFGRIALPVMQAYAMQGITNPWNAFVQDYSKALDLDGEPYIVQIPPPQPDPQKEMEMQIQQQKLAAQQQKSQADVMKAQMEVQGKQLDLQGKQMDAELKVAAGMQGVEANALKNQGQQVDIAARMKELQLDTMNSLLKLDILRSQKEQLNGKSG